MVSPTPEPNEAGGSGYPPQLRTVTDGVSPKATTSGAVGLLVGIVVALLNGLQNDPSMLGALPTWLQSVILIIVPPVLAFLGSYGAPPGPVTTRALGR